MRIDILKTLGIKKPFEKAFNERRDALVSDLEDALFAVESVGVVAEAAPLRKVIADLKSWRL